MEAIDVSFDELHCVLLKMLVHTSLLDFCYKPKLRYFEFFEYLFKLTFASTPKPSSSTYFFELFSPLSAEEQGANPSKHPSSAAVNLSDIEVQDLEANVGSTNANKKVPDLRHKAHHLQNWAKQSLIKSFTTLFSNYGGLCTFLDEEQLQEIGGQPVLFFPPLELPTPTTSTSFPVSPSRTPTMSRVKKIKAEEDKTEDPLPLQFPTLQSLDTSTPKSVDNDKRDSKDQESSETNTVIEAVKAKLEMVQQTEGQPEVDEEKIKKEVPSQLLSLGIVEELHFLGEQACFSRFGT
jgi:hypothetical protein